LVEAQMNDIALLCRAGVPIYGNERFEPLFEQFTPHYNRVCVGNTAPNSPTRAQNKLAAGDPVALIQHLSQTVGRPLEFPFLPLITNEEQRSCPTS
jgi:hypothetical protein